jgi:hypothetical protein
MGWPVGLCLVDESRQVLRCAGLGTFALDEI